MDLSGLYKADWPLILKAERAGFHISALDDSNIGVNVLPDLKLLLEPRPRCRSQALQAMYRMYKEQRWLYRRYDPPRVPGQPGKLIHYSVYQVQDCSSCGAHCAKALAWRACDN
jgi:hypothetical protein